MAARVLALVVLIAVALFGAAPRAASYVCRIDGRARAHCCCGTHDAPAADQAARFERRDCCEVESPEMDAAPSSLPSPDGARASFAMAVDASWTVASSPATAVDPAPWPRGPPVATGPPLRIRHCSFLI